MTTATDRGWGDPRSADFRRNITTVTVGPFPAAGALKSPHPKASINVHAGIAYLLRGALTESITRYGYRISDGALDDWGYMCRPVRGYETKYRLTRSLRYLSNHSWGLAVDINSAQFPLGSPKRAPQEIVECWRRWGFEYGGDYHDRKDPMHWEVTMTRAATQQKVADFEKFFG